MPAASKKTTSDAELFGVLLLTVALVLIAGIVLASIIHPAHG
jgi:hypothetical protein